MITTEDELFEDVKHWKARADAAEAMSQLQTEARLRAEAKVTAAIEVIRAAGMMANVCYNAKQNDKVPEGIRAWLANTQEAFDKARDAYLADVGGSRE